MPNHVCVYCEEERPADKRCSGCKKVWYCGTSCQKDHWDLHIFDCNPKRPPSTAHHLVRAAIRDAFPDDPQTLKDFGFNKASTPKNASNLLGLYRGLFLDPHNIAQVDAKKLHKWRVDGRLIPEIIATYEKMRAHGSLYFQWFLQNQWVLDDSLPGLDDPIPDMSRRAWEYAGGTGPTPSVEEIKAAIEPWSPERKACFMLCVLSLSRFTPARSESTWIDFGFCTCKESAAEYQLGRCYTELLAKYTFDEFCDAYDSAKLFSLLQTTPEGSVAFTEPFKDMFIPHLEQFLSMKGAHYSVWDLKQLVLAEENMELIPSVTVDYGFINCKTPDEFEELKDVYKKYFAFREGDPVDLHNACIQGKLYDQVGRVATRKLPKKFKRLMENVYPLQLPE